MKLKKLENIKILVYGDGDCLNELRANAKEKGLNNIFFKGRVEKKFIPSILSRSSINIMDFFYHKIFDYGVSPNKLFDYLASGKPILAVRTNYDLIERFDCGLISDTLEPREISRLIEEFTKMDSETYERMAKNALLAANSFDFKNLTNELVKIMQNG